ncbi:MAG: nicotinate-nucleotide--dimethylbenzimidazole phosphoribosyltransferase [Acidobacteriota bacterium]|nr:nicotinate-nucleotide--dimethylbenzimidazole phosphoribosyltransferase [Acidobacteriota bacterium]
MTLLKRTLAAIQPIDPKWLTLAEARQLELTKPPGSLGRLEEIANRCVAIFGSLSFHVDKPRIVLFAADHGVCAEGVSAYPQAVTAQMVLNFLRGGAAINCLARTAGIDLKIVNAGIAGPLPHIPELLDRCTARGTRNFCVAPAMTANETAEAIEAGIEIAELAVADGCNLLGFGEMGIGNTTAASALTAAMTGLSASAVIGRGAGADDDCLKRKAAAVERALTLHSAHLDDTLEMLACIGGLEIAAMCGFCLGAAAQRIPVLTDGFIATAAAAIAVRLHPAVKDYLFAAHASVEPGHQPLLDFICQKPILQLGMRLGEGTGAALAIPIVQSAAAAFTGMATFSSAGVSDAVQPVIQT